MSAPIERPAEELLELKAEKLAALAALLSGDDASSFQAIPETKQAGVLDMLREIADDVEQLAAEVVAELHAARRTAA